MLLLAISFVDRFLLLAKKNIGSLGYSIIFKQARKCVARTRHVNIVRWSYIHRGGGKERKKKYKILGAESSASVDGGGGGNCWIRVEGEEVEHTKLFFFFFFFEMSPLQNVKYKRSSRAQSTQRPQFLRESLVRPFFFHIPVLHTRSFVILVIKRMGKFLETGLSNDPQ